MNVLAIVLAAVIVLLATDFMESPSLRNPTVATSAVAAIVVAVAVTIPVWRTSRRADDRATFARSADIALQEWADTHTGHRVVNADVTPGAVSVVIAGPSSPPGLDTLRIALVTDAFPNPTLDVEWVESAPAIPD